LRIAGLTDHGDPFAVSLPQKRENSGKLLLDFFAILVYTYREGFSGGMVEKKDCVESFERNPSFFEPETFPQEKRLI